MEQGNECGSLRRGLTSAVSTTETVRLQTCRRRSLTARNALLRCRCLAQRPEAGSGPGKQQPKNHPECAFLCFECRGKRKAHSPVQAKPSQDAAAHDRFEGRRLAQFTF